MYSYNDSNCYFKLQGLMDVNWFFALVSYRYTINYISQSFKWNKYSLSHLITLIPQKIIQERLPSTIFHGIIQYDMFFADTGTGYLHRTVKKNIWYKKEHDSSGKCMAQKPKGQAKRYLKITYCNAYICLDLLHHFVQRL